MDKFIHPSAVKRYSRLLERVTEESDRQLIINLLAESSRSKKTLTIRSAKSDGMAANFASCRAPAAPTKTRWSCTY